MADSLCDFKKKALGVLDGLPAGLVIYDMTIVDSHPHGAISVAASRRHTNRALMAPVDSRP